MWCLNWSKMVNCQSRSHLKINLVSSFASVSQPSKTNKRKTNESTLSVSNRGIRWIVPLPKRPCFVPLIRCLPFKSHQLANMWLFRTKNKREKWWPLDPSSPADRGCVRLSLIHHIKIKWKQRSTKRSGQPGVRGWPAWWRGPGEVRIFILKFIYQLFYHDTWTWVTGNHWNQISLKWDGQNIRTSTKYKAHLHTPTTHRDTQQIHLKM